MPEKRHDLLVGAINTINNDLQVKNVYNVSMQKTEVRVLTRGGAFVNNAYIEELIRTIEENKGAETEGEDKRLEEALTNAKRLIAIISVRENQGEEASV